MPRFCREPPGRRDGIGLPAPGARLSSAPLRRLMIYSLSLETALLLVGGVMLLLHVVALVASMDLGEFSTWRRMLKIGTPIAAVLLWMFVEEFLAVRALGMLVLLAAE